MLFPNQDIQPGDREDSEPTDQGQSARCRGQRILDRGPEGSVEPPEGPEGSSGPEPTQQQEVDPDDSLSLVR